MDYPPEKLRSFFRNSYEWIDNLDFSLDPLVYIANAEAYLQVARELFVEMGWAGDGEIRLMWIPPFMLDGIHTQRFTRGVIIWQVKQQEDGISWILSPLDLDSLEKQWVIFDEDDQNMQQAGRVVAKTRNVQYIKA